MTELLAARDLTFEVRGCRLVDRVDVVAEAGRVLAIVGPNGAGKSTLLRLLSESFGDERRGVARRPADRGDRTSASC